MKAIVTLYYILYQVDFSHILTKVVYTICACIIVSETRVEEGNWVNVAALSKTRCLGRTTRLLLLYIVL